LRRATLTARRAARSIQPQLRDVLRIGLELALLDALDEVGEDRIGAAGKPELPCPCNFLLRNL